MHKIIYLLCKFPRYYLDSANFSFIESPRTIFFYLVFFFFSRCVACVNCERLRLLLYSWAFYCCVYDWLTTFFVVLTNFSKILNHFESWTFNVYGGKCIYKTEFSCNAIFFLPCALRNASLYKVKRKNIEFSSDGKYFPKIKIYKPHEKMVKFSAFATFFFFLSHSSSPLLNDAMCLVNFREKKNINIKYTQGRIGFSVFVCVLFFFPLVFLYFVFPQNNRKKNRKWCRKGIHLFDKNVYCISFCLCGALFTQNIIILWNKGVVKL